MDQTLDTNQICSEQLPAGEKSKTTPMPIYFEKGINLQQLKLMSNSSETIEDTGFHSQVRVCRLEASFDEILDISRDLGNDRS